MTRDEGEANKPFVAAYGVEFGSDPGVDVLDFISRAPIRVELLDNIRKGKPPDADLDASAGGISDNLSDLEEYEFIKEDPEEGYQLTILAEMIVEDYFELKATAHTVRKLQLFLKHIPNWEAELGTIIEFLEDARVFTATSADPRQPVKRYQKLVKEADKICELVPFLYGIENEFWREQVVEGKLEGEFISTTKMINSSLLFEDAVELWEDMYDSGQAHYWHYEGEIPFALTIFSFKSNVLDDNKCALAVKEPRFILVESNSEEVREWAERTFERYKQESEPTSPYQF